MIVGKICEESGLWDEIIHDLGGHPLQLWGWGELKSAHGWSAHRVMFVDENENVIGAAQLLVKRLPGLFGRLIYAPRGPVWREGKGSAVLEGLAKYVKEHLPGMVLTIEPDVEQIPDAPGWRKSKNTILIPRTLILDLCKSEEELLESMTKKTRQYIRKSGRENITIRQVKDREVLDECLAIYHETAGRAGFALHNDDYYYDVSNMLGESSQIFAAFHGEKPVAFLWIALSSVTAFELYGGMNVIGHDLRANYALKWFAIQKCKEWGIERYDLNGLLNDGVSTFKQGFADHEDMLAGTYDYPLSPLYTLWSKVLPFAKKIVRILKTLRK